MTTDWKALCAELLAWAEKTSSHYYKQADVLLRARAALADGPAVPEGREPASVTGQPTQRQLMRLADEMGMASTGDAALYARAVLARWGNPAAAPVPVSERLPGPKDCDAEGRCWLWERDCGYSGCKWALVDRTWSLSQSDEDLSVYTHWLSAHALPVPEQEVSE